MLQLVLKVFDTKIKFIKRVFKDNSYPMNIVENCIFKLIDKTLNHVQQCDNIMEKHYIKLPYYCHLCFVIRKKTKSDLETSLPWITFRLIFTNSLTIKSFFPYKDTIPTHLISNMVYQYTCSLCNQRYVGEATRNFAEHKGISARTCTKLSNPFF